LLRFPEHDLDIFGMAFILRLLEFHASIKTSYSRTTYNGIYIKTKAKSLNLSSSSNSSETTQKLCQTFLQKCKAHEQNNTKWGPTNGAAFRRL